MRCGVTAALLLFQFCCALVLSAQQAPGSSVARKPAVAIETDSQEQYERLARSFRTSSYPLSLAGNALRGPGADFLRKKVANAQFVLIGEEHNVKQVPEFSAALFAMLHECCGFNYLALESDPISAHIASLPPLKENVELLRDYAAKFPNAFTFATDEELAMIASAEKASLAKTDSVWGLDQSFGVLHALEALRILPGVNGKSALFQELLADSQNQDSKRVVPDKHYMEMVKLEDLEKLRHEILPQPHTEADFILSNLISSSRIYSNYTRGARGEPTGYLSGLEREEQMKQLFLRGYSSAQAAGEKNPKVLLKLGHWHVFRGLGPSGLQTLGDFATEFAVANGYIAFNIAVFIHGSPNKWREIGEWKGMKPFAMAASPTEWSVIDFEPIRKAVFTGELGTLSPTMLRYVFGFDAALIIANGSPADTSVVDAPRHNP